MKITEKQIESEILFWLNAQPGCFAFKVNTLGIFDKTRMIYRRNKNPYLVKGTSDIIGVFRGLFFAIEVKSAKGKVTEDQENFLKKVALKGGRSLVARSLNQVISWFQLFSTQSIPS